MLGNSALDCGTWEIPRSRISAADSLSIRSPWRCTSPSRGVSSPLTVFRTVDLPAPLGPTMQATEPAGTLMSTPWSTSPPP